MLPAGVKNYDKVMVTIRYLEMLLLSVILAVLMFIIIFLGVPPYPLFDPVLSHRSSRRETIPQLVGRCALFWDLKRLMILCRHR